MKLDVLKTGLKMLLNDDRYAADAKAAISEIAEIELRAGNYDKIWNNECFAVPAWSVDNFMIETTYDTYGNLYKSMQDIGHEVTLTDYELACRQKPGFESLPLSIISLGFEVVSTLYADNEEFGQHE